MSCLLAFVLFQITGFTIYRTAKLTPMSSFLSGIFFATVVTYIFGIFNLLYFGRLIFFVAVFIFLFYDIYINRKANYFSYIKSYFNIFNIMNCIACILFLFIYIIQNPLFSYWDEYSFWGFSAKAAAEFHYLLPSFDFIYHYNEGIIAGSSVLSYVFSIFAPSFNDYTLLFSYTTIVISTFAMATEFIILKTQKSNMYLSPVLFLLFCVTPFLQTYNTPTADFNSIHYAYSTSLVDFLIAIIAFSAVIIYFSNKEKPIYIISLLVLTLIKDVGIFFAILCMCIIVCFELFSGRKDRKSYVKKAANILLAVFAIFLIYTSWPSYLNREINDVFSSPVDLVTVESLEYQKSSELAIAQSQPREEIIPAAKEGNLVQQIISDDYRNSMQNDVISSMLSQFLTSKNTFYINDMIVYTMLVLLGFIGVFFINKQYKLALFIANIGVSIGLIVYLLAISLFIANFNDGMVEYPRYSISYYWLWIYLVITLISILLVIYKKNVVIYIMTLLFSFNLYNIGLEHTVISSPDNRYETAIMVKNESDKYNDVFNENPRVLLVSDRFNDYKLMVDTYYTIPSLVNTDTLNSGFDFTMNFSNIEFLDDTTLPYFIVVTDEEFLNIAFQNFDYIYITHKQSEFVESFKDYFNSDIAPYSLFKVNENSAIPFEVVK